MFLLSATRHVLDFFRLMPVVALVLVGVVQVLAGYVVARFPRRKHESD